VLEHQAQAILEVENRALQPQVEQLTWLRQANHGLTNLLAQGRTNGSPPDQLDRLGNEAAQGQPAPGLATSRPKRLHLPAPPMPAMPQAQDLQLTNLDTRLVHGEEFKLSQAQVESYLDGHGRSAEGLIAGLFATGDPAMLREALEKYPNDPLVKLMNYGTAISQNESPEERRQRLDAFKR